MCVWGEGTYKTAVSCGSTSYQLLHFSEEVIATTRRGGPWLVGECSIPIPSLNYGMADTGVGTLCAALKGTFLMFRALHTAQQKLFLKFGA